MRDTTLRTAPADFEAVTEHRPRNAGGWVTKITFPGHEAVHYLAIPGYSQPVEVLAYQAPTGTHIHTRRGTLTRTANANWFSESPERDMVVSPQTVYHVLMTEFMRVV